MAKEKKPSPTPDLDAIVEESFGQAGVVEGAEAPAEASGGPFPGTMTSRGMVGPGVLTKAAPPPPRFWPEKPDAMPAAGYTAEMALANLKDFLDFWENKSDAGHFRQILRERLEALRAGLA